MPNLHICSDECQQLASTLRNATAGTGERAACQTPADSELVEESTHIPSPVRFQDNPSKKVLHGSNTETCNTTENRSTPRNSFQRIRNQTLSNCNISSITWRQL